MGRGRERTEMALLTSAICRAYAGNACVPGTKQVAHPREGTDQQVGGLCPGDHSLQRTTLTCLGNFATLNCLKMFSTKRSVPGDCSRAEEEAEGGSKRIPRLERKEVRGGGGGLGLQTVKFALPDG